MTVKELLAEITKTLLEANFESPDLEASLIIADSLGVPHIELPLQNKRKFHGNEEAKIRAVLTRRLEHEPLQYIFGEAYFRFLKVEVGPGCLIPRPETEFLAEIVMGLAPKGGSVCELGAGSGALGLAVASERPDLKVQASEISPEAFKWAELNSRELALENYKLFNGDLFSPFKGMTFDIVMANLPYIPRPELGTLPPEVRLREPELALDGGTDGLDIIRRAVAEAPNFLKKGGHIVLEMAETQGPALLELLNANKSYKNCLIRKDLCDKERFALAMSASC